MTEAERFAAYRASKMTLTMPRVTDWRALLVKYMAHVMDEEGISYVSTYLGSTDPFTPEERAALEAVEAEANGPLGDIGPDAFEGPQVGFD